MPFVQKGITLDVHGDANDYFGKGLSGGKLIIQPKKKKRLSSQMKTSLLVMGTYMVLLVVKPIFVVWPVNVFAVRNSGASLCSRRCW